MKVIVILFHFIRTAIAMTVLEKTCQTFSYYFYHGHSCFVPSSDQKTFVQAKAQCEMPKPNLPIGDLAYILTQETINAWIQADSDGKCFSSKYHFVGLEQIPASDESEGGTKGWTWTHPFLPNRPTPHHDIILWYNVSPHDQFETDDVAMLDVSEGGVVDGRSGGTPYYLCEYEEPSLRKYHRCQRDKIGHNTTSIAEYNGLSRLDCAQKCADDLMCRSLSFNQVTHHCIIHWTDGCVTNFGPIQKNGYDFYVSHYSYNQTMGTFPVCTV